MIGSDPADARLARRAPQDLRAFNDAGVLDAADVHVASRLATLVDEPDGTVVLAAALAARAPRLGSVFVDLTEAAGTVTTEADTPVDVGALPWPDTRAWLTRVGSSRLVASGSRVAGHRPLRLVGSRLYLDRYWRQEREVAAHLRKWGAEAVPDVDTGVLTAGLERLFSGGAPDLQRLAAATAVLRRVSVIAGGPGTGKTTTVARVLALLDEQAQAAGAPRPHVGLAAPTGKAAARLEEAVHHEAAVLDVRPDTREWLSQLAGATLHRLLGWRPGNRSRFRHDRANRLPHDVVVVDETSMVALSLMARMVEAVGTGARLVLLGDPEQLASVEAGAVLGDIVGPAGAGLRMRPHARAVLAAASGHSVPAGNPPRGAAIGDGIVVLRRAHRYGSAIAELAEAIKGGDDDAAIGGLRHGGADIAWIDADPVEASKRDELAAVRESVVSAATHVTESARAGDARAALAGLAAMRLLCAHRRGPHGVASWTPRVERWLDTAIDGYGGDGRWYVGQPVLVTRNDYGLGLFNGDVGVIVAAGGRPAAAFERRGKLLQVSPSRLAAVETVHAMTVHKSQGSQFAEVAVLLPDASSRILTRELLYTAVTRARRRLTLVGAEAAVRAAVQRPIARASGLGELLWSSPEDESR